MKSKLIYPIVLVAGFGVACGGRSTASNAAQQQYETVQEGSAAGVTSTIQGPGETLPPITGTNADTTTAFALNPGAMPPATAPQPGGALPSYSAASTPPPMMSSAPPPAYSTPAPARPTPAAPQQAQQPAPVQPAPAQPAPTQTAEPQPAEPAEAEGPATDTAATAAPEPPKKEEPAPPPPADDTSGTQAEEPPPPPPAA